VSEELGEIIVDKETARASYVLLSSYIFLLCIYLLVRTDESPVIDEGLMRRGHCLVDSPFMFHSVLLHCLLGDRKDTSGLFTICIT